MVPFFRILAVSLFCISTSTALAADLPPPGPTQTYKGIVLIGSAYSGANNEQFFSMVKQGIDMTEKLPKLDRWRIAAIRTIQFDPPTKQRNLDDHRKNIVGVYTMLDDIRQPGILVIYKKLSYSSPMEIAMSLMGNGYHAKRQHLLSMLLDRIEKIKQGKLQASADVYRYAQGFRDRMYVLINKSDPELQGRSECEILKSLLNAMKVFGADSTQQNGLTSELSRRNCWNKTVEVEAKAVQLIRKLDGQK